MASGHLFLPIHMHARQSVHVFSVGRGESAAAGHLAQLISLVNKRIGHVVIQMPDPYLSPNIGHRRTKWARSANIHLMYMPCPMIHVTRKNKTDLHFKECLSSTHWGGSHFVFSSQYYES